MLSRDQLQRGAADGGFQIKAPMLLFHGVGSTRTRAFGNRRTVAAKRTVGLTNRARMYDRRFPHALSLRF
jgi:hypothetical protein